MSGERTQSDDHHDRGAVRLSVPASPRHAATARVLAASIAADAGFDVDAIDDLRLAVNEAVAVLTDVEASADSDRLEIEFLVQNGSIQVELHRSGTSASGSAGTDQPPAELDDLARTILSAVVDHHEIVDGRFRLTKSTGGPDQR